MRWEGSIILYPITRKFCANPCDLGVCDTLKFSILILFSHNSTHFQLKVISNICFLPILFYKQKNEFLSRDISLVNYNWLLLWKTAKKNVFIKRLYCFEISYLGQICDIYMSTSKNYETSLCWFSFCNIFLCNIHELLENFYLLLHLLLLKWFHLE